MAQARNLEFLKFEFLVVLWFFGTNWLFVILNFSNLGRLKNFAYSGKKSVNIFCILKYYSYICNVKSSLIILIVSYARSVLSLDCRQYAQIIY